MTPKFLKSNCKLVIISAALLAMPRLADATVISSLPFTISSSGRYTLNSDLTAAGGSGITVSASNVVLDLNGFTIAQSTTGTGQGIIIKNRTNVTVENGTLSGWAEGVQVQGIQNIIQNLPLLKNTFGVIISANDCLVQGCSIVGAGTSSGDLGIELNFVSGTQVINNRLLECYEGVLNKDGTGSTPGNGIIHNYVANCFYGLVFSPNDKYQDNVATNCVTPFSGGIAVGNNNG